MPATTRLVGLLLAVLGIVSYVGTGRTSVTALIPAFFGVAFVLLAWVGRNEAARKHAMHAAMVVALVGIAGTASRLIPGIAAAPTSRARPCWRSSSPWCCWPGTWARASSRSATPAAPAADCNGVCHRHSLTGSARPEL